MSDILKTYGSGRLTKNPETISYGDEGKTLTRFSVASDTGTKERPSVVFNNCTCFGKSGEAIAKYFNQGDVIFFEGVPTQNKKDDKVFNGITITSWNFGPKKKGTSNPIGDDHDSQDTGENNPFSDDDIPF